MYEFQFSVVYIDILCMSFARQDRKEDVAAIVNNHSATAMEVPSKDIY